MRNKVMGKILKGVGVLLVVLLGLTLVVVTAVYAITENQINTTYVVQVMPVDIPADQASIERGKHLVETIGFCGECHGPDYAGQVFDEGPMMGRIGVKNLTSGAGGIGATYTDEDWVRSIRHGVGPDDKSLIEMPSHIYYHFSDEDLSAIIAYMKSLPPVDNIIPSSRFGPMGRLYVLQTPSFLTATMIDHKAVRPPAPEPGITIEYGRYLSYSCQVCHGEDMAGGDQFGSGVNLTPAGEVGTWTEADFMRAMQTGVRPNGEALDPELMPWEQIRKLMEDELKAMWLYLQSLPPVETPQRAPE
jgi:mono/diheme cytochrome c family protein